ncbi:serine/arginine-rich SC35-like splicing factor SCL28 isoform X2 [Phragmites australis]|uniref:serine/arginine-rich SC35-like splicing factor SCL28 isoform X2 n=1 Tax=Phragmites australis TaxID=29695 RepID=UPI002D76C355|nr:serine/arginine-rich SC35-like splicing factor SCL28 isoform X2 [Phragmites australis]XP_062211357.1 serine/arginine-rich SC35-like splicing factor SCL28 isoform X2 [Phragmites australis]
MAGYHSRSRSRSYSPQHRRYSRSPPRRKRYDDPRDRYRGSGGGRFGARRGYGRPAAPSGLLVRNISLTARPEDLRVPFEQFGPVKDIYLPRNFHTRELRGFGFVKFRYPEDAAVAKQEMNHKVIGGREISIVYAEENRKTPQEMSTRTRTSGRYMDGSYTRPSLSRSPRSRYHFSWQPIHPHLLQLGVTSGAGIAVTIIHLGSRTLRILATKADMAGPPVNGRSPSKSRSRS